MVGAMDSQINKVHSMRSKELQTSLTYYIHSLESFINALEKRQALSYDSFIQDSLELLEQIHQQMVLLENSRSPLISLSNSILSENDLLRPQQFNFDSFFKNSTHTPSLAKEKKEPAQHNKPNKKTKQNKKESAQLKKNKKNVRNQNKTYTQSSTQFNDKSISAQIPFIDNSSAAPPWKPKKESRD